MDEPLLVSSIVHKQLPSLIMSGSIIRANGWKNGIEEQFIGLNPAGNTITIYETVSNSPSNPDAEYDDDDDKTIRRVIDRNGFQQIDCVQYSPPNQGCLAVGLRGGTVKIFENIFDKQGNQHHLEPKFSRSCTSLSFNGDNLLAASYDRARQDQSIKIFDLLRLDSTQDPITSFATNETISSVRFYPNTPSVLLSGSSKLLREFDKRIPNQATFQVTTRCTMNISINPFNNNIFASNSQEGIIALWDRRKMTAHLSLQANLSSSSLTSVAASPIPHLHNVEALKFDKLPDYRKSNNSPFRFSPYKKNEFAVLLKEPKGPNGSLSKIRRYRYDFMPALPSMFKQYESTLEQAKLENPNSAPFVKSLPIDQMFVATVHAVVPKYERVISFDYAPNIKGSRSIDLVCMKQSGTVYRMSVPESQNALDINSYNNLTFSGTLGTCTKFIDDITDEQFKISDSSNESKKNAEASRVMGNDDNASIEDGDSTEVGPRDLYEDESNLELLYDTGHLASDDLLKNDVCAVIRKRAYLGYNMDSSKNMQVLEMIKTNTSQDQLKNTWKWIDISYHLISSGKMISENYDFGYLGVLGIWNMDKGMDNQIGRFNGSGSVTKKDLIKAAKTIVERRTNEIKYLAADAIGFNGKSKKEVERRLAMYVIGWDFGPTELEGKYESLITNHNHARAAGWALFHNDIPRAAQILFDSKIESFKIMSTAISAYSAYMDTQQNNPWREQCRKLASDLGDPYLRAIFGYIADGNWWDVLDELALPLRERLGVALRFLPDVDLDLYLNRLADTVIRTGEIEGVIVTGLTENGIDLLQSYVDRTSDIQSASLIASFACPKYFKDERVDEWIYDYRTLLNSWNLFSVRAKYDVARTKLSKRIDGSIQTKPVPRQVYLQCVNCHKNISRKKVINGNSRNGNGNGSGNTNGNGTFNQTKSESRSVCPHCGYPLPRCAICLLSQGSSIPKEVVNLDLVGEMNNISLETKTQFQEWFSICLSCNHTMHAGHAEEWFSKHFVCPVPDCDCRCNDK